MNKLRVFEAHRSQLIDYAASVLGCRALAEDVVQDAWLRFARADDGSITQPASYLYRIVRNLALDVVRRHDRELRHAGEETVEPQAVADSAEDAVACEQTLQLAARALEELAPETRTVFELYRFQGLTLQAVADRLGISVATAHRRVRTALMHIHRNLPAPSDASGRQ